LIERIKNGERFYSGERIQYKASEFRLGLPVNVVDHNGVSVLVSGDDQGVDKDSLQNIPLI
jgi:hypothetical protein